MNSEVMYVGIPKNVADFGSLQMKPIEYKQQIPDTFKTEGNLATPASSNNKTFDNYIDIRPFLIKSPVMQAFLNR